MRVASTDMQNNFGKYLKYAEANEEIIITRNGKNVAKLFAYRDWVKENAAEYSIHNENWVTYEEYLELVKESEQRFELIDGVIYNLASPSYKHQHAISELHVAFYNWFKGKSCDALTSPLDVTFHKSDNNICVVQPDLLVICDKDQIDLDGKYCGIPELLVEVLSPSTRSKDMLKKLELYKECGVKEYWIVDPMNDCVHVYSLDERDIKDVRTFLKSANHSAESSHFTGLNIPLGDVFV